MDRKKTSKESFTAYPNRYTDTIKSKLTDTQKALCDVVIRLTYGWHRSSARISNDTFVVKTGKSERAIVTAKKQLMDMGLLVMLEPPKSGKPALYTLDLYYDDPERSMKQLQPDVSDDSDTTPTTGDRHDEPGTTAPVNEPTETTTDADTTPDESNAQADLPSPSGDDDITPASLIPADDPGDNADTSKVCDTADKDTCPTQPVSDPDSSSNPSAVEQVKTSGKLNCMQGTVEVDATTGPIYTDINSTNKQTKENVISQSDTGSRQAGVRAVCYNFIKLFPEAKGDTLWRFVGWCVSTYGQDKCVEKLDYLREYRKLHPIANPAGLFRVALVKDYQPTRWITGMIKARRKAEAEYQRSQALLAEMEAAKANVNWEAGQAALANIIAMLEQKEEDR